MDAADIAGWLKWGSGRKRKSTDISRWRVGGKAACGYLGDDLALYAKAAGSDDIWFFEDHGWATREEVGNWGEPEPVPSSVPLPPSLADAGRAEGFVRIEIRKQRQKVYNIEDLRFVLSNTYRTLLEKGDLTIEINGERVAPLALPRNSSRKDTPIDLKTSLGHRVRGWVGRLDRDKTARGISAKRRISGGLRCTYQGRLICSGEYFGHAGDTKGSLASLIGEVELAFVTPTPNKTDFDRGSPEWAAVEAVMHPFLAPIIREFTKASDAGKASRAERKTLNTVCGELAEAFRRVQRDDVWPGK
ncbi:MAG: hypothetical protein IIC50_25045, partial [Planctomycetes bacterium]|nr:hypothetical protein [Planctomycetota bacterium]